MSAPVISRTLAGLDAEARFRELPDVQWPAIDWLLRNGVPSPAIVCPDLPRRAQAVFHPDLPLFDLAEDVGEEGVEALAFLARDDLGDPSDIVAWSCRYGRLAAYFGACSVLGEDEILAPRLTPEAALSIHRTPLEWLRSGREGVVVLSAERAAIALRDVGHWSPRTRSTVANCERYSDVASRRYLSLKRGPRHERAHQP